MMRELSMLAVSINIPVEQIKECLPGIAAIAFISLVVFLMLKLVRKDKIKEKQRNIEIKQQNLRIAEQKEIKRIEKQQKNAEIIESMSKEWKEIYDTCRNMKHDGDRETIVYACMVKSTRNQPITLTQLNLFLELWQSPVTQDRIKQQMALFVPNPLILDKNGDLIDHADCETLNSNPKKGYKITAVQLPNTNKCVKCGTPIKQAYFTYYDDLACNDCYNARNENEGWEIHETQKYPEGGVTTATHDLPGDIVPSQRRSKPLNRKCDLCGEMIEPNFNSSHCRKCETRNHATLDIALCRGRQLCPNCGEPCDGCLYAHDMKECEYCEGNEMVIHCGCFHGTEVLTEDEKKDTKPDQPNKDEYVALRSLCYVCGTLTPPRRRINGHGYMVCQNCYMPLPGDATRRPQGDLEAPKTKGIKPTDAIVEKVVQIVSEQMSVEKRELNRETSFIKDLNVDSLDTIELVMELEDEFDLMIPDEEVEKLKTVGSVIDLIQKLIKTPVSGELKSVSTSGWH